MKNYRLCLTFQERVPIIVLMNTSSVFISLLIMVKSLHPYIEQQLKKPNYCQISKILRNDPAFRHSPTQNTEACMLLLLDSVMMIKIWKDKTYQSWVRMVNNFSDSRSPGTPAMIYPLFMTICCYMIANKKEVMWPERQQPQQLNAEEVAASIRFWNSIYFHFCFH